MGNDLKTLNRLIGIVIYILEGYWLGKNREGWLLLLHLPILLLLWLNIVLILVVVIITLIVLLLSTIVRLLHVLLGLLIGVIHVRVGSGETILKRLIIPVHCICANRRPSSALILRLELLN